MSEGLGKIQINFLERKEEIMLLHQPPPSPDECQKPYGSCSICSFLEQCYEFLEKKHPRPSKKELKEIEIEAQQVSLRSLSHEKGYRPDE